VVCAASVVLGSTVSAVGDGSDEPVLVIEVSDPLDQRVIDYITESLRTADVHLFVLKINSPGVSSGDLTALFEAERGADAPVVAWIGPSPAVAFGGSAYIANHADVRSAAPGTRIGFLDPAIQRSGDGPPSVVEGDDPGAFVATVASLNHAVVSVDAAGRPVVGFVDRVDPALGQLIVALDGEVIVHDGRAFTLDTATTRMVGDEEVTVASRPVRFTKDGLVDRFLRLGARPETAFLFLVFALAFAAFEFYAAGSGLMAFVAGISMIVAGYGLGTLPMRWPALGMVIVGFGLWIWGFVQNRVGWRAVAGSILVLAGGLTYTTTRPAYPPGIWLVMVATIGSGLFVWYALTTVVRGRFATPTVGREDLLGRRCVAVSDLEPVGVVLLDGARWRATADRGVRITAGAPAEIVGITGLLLEVDPVSGQSTIH
jgi:membrane-bound serine protease (ClpP class)